MPHEDVEVETVQRTVALPAPVEEVWGALTVGDHLSAWFGGDVEIEAFPGGQIVVSEDGRRRRGVIVDFDPLRHLEIRWLPASRRIGFVWGPDDDPAGSGGEVEFRLEPVDVGGVRLTRLTVVERAPAHARALAVA
jgi:uncharacterized protein YndB with AHSA1/START domain